MLDRYDQQNRRWFESLKSVVGRGPFEPACPQEFKVDAHQGDATAKHTNVLADNLIANLDNRAATEQRAQEHQMHLVGTGHDSPHSQLSYQPLL